MGRLAVLLVLVVTKRRGPRGVDHFSGRGGGWLGRRRRRCHIGEILVEDEIIIRVGRAAAVVEVAVVVAGGVSGKARVDLGIVIGIELAILIRIAIEGVFDQNAVGIHRF